MSDFDFIIVSAADANYAPLLSELTASIRAHAKGRDVPMGVLDLGLDEDGRAALAASGVLVRNAEWDLDFRGRETKPAHYKAIVSRPFLPRYFPGYDHILWIDCDAWVQDWTAVEHYLDAARRGLLAITPEIDRSYRRYHKRPRLFGWGNAFKWYRSAFGWRVADRLARRPVLNVGAFAMAADAPHWAAWQDRLRAVLARWPGGWFAEQAAMNHVVYREGLPATFLPATCNWLVDGQPPMFDPERGLLVEPNAPWTPIGVVHNAGSGKKEMTFPVRTLDGRTIETSLRHGRLSSDLAAPVREARA